MNKKCEEACPLCSLLSIYDREEKAAVHIETGMVYGSFFPLKTDERSQRLMLFWIKKYKAALMLKSELIIQTLTHKKPPGTTRNL
jgi:hypothetical protein